jgi:hypothetical protein
MICLAQTSTLAANFAVSIQSWKDRGESEDVQSIVQKEKERTRVHRRTLGLTHAEPIQAKVFTCSHRVKRRVVCL